MVSIAVKKIHKIFGEKNTQISKMLFKKLQIDRKLFFGIQNFETS